MQVHGMLPKYIRSHLRRLGKEEQGESGPTRLLILETKKKKMGSFSGRAEVPEASRY